MRHYGTLKIPTPTPAPDHPQMLSKKFLDLPHNFQQQKHCTSNNNYQRRSSKERSDDVGRGPCKGKWSLSWMDSIQHQEFRWDNRNRVLRLRRCFLPPSCKRRSGRPWTLLLALGQSASAIPRNTRSIVRQQPNPCSTGAPKQQQPAFFFSQAAVWSDLDWEQVHLLWSE